MVSEEETKVKPKSFPLTHVVFSSTSLLFCNGSSMEMRVDAGCSCCLVLPGHYACGVINHSLTQLCYWVVLSSSRRPPC